MTWMAAAIMGGAVVNAASTAWGASKAADAQTSAAANAANAQMQMFRTTQRNLKPYQDAGKANLATLEGQLPYLTSPIKMDEATLEQTPGYQFTLRQGLKAVQNSAAARGLGVSGAAEKGAAEYATGLADKTYMDQFNLENINRSNAFNRLKGLVDLGESAAGGASQAALTTGSGIAGSDIAAGNATAAGYNAYGAGGNIIGNGATTAALAYGLYNKPTGAPTGAPPTPALPTKSPYYGGTVEG
jgi:hypothetical protein